MAPALSLFCANFSQVPPLPPSNHPHCRDKNLPQASFHVSSPLPYHLSPWLLTLFHNTRASGRSLHPPTSSSIKFEVIPETTLTSQYRPTLKQTATT